LYLCLWQEWHRSGMVFLVNILLIQPGKNPKKIPPKKIPTPGQNFTKVYVYHSVIVTHVLYHFCDMSFIDNYTCVIFCSLKFHVVCTCTFYGDIICLLTNRKMIKIVTLIDSHIVLTYDCWHWHCFIVFNISVSHGSEMTIILLPNPWVVLFSFTKHFTHDHSLCLPNPCLFGANPHHK
jgi:hypothetical protein